MVAAVNKTCRWISIYDTAHFIRVHLLVCCISVQRMDTEHIKTAQSDYRVLNVKLS